MVLGFFSFAERVEGFVQGQAAKRLRVSCCHRCQLRGSVGWGAEGGGEKRFTSTELFVSPAPLVPREFLLSCASFPARNPSLSFLTLRVLHFQGIWEHHNHPAAFPAQKTPKFGGKGQSFTCKGTVSVGKAEEELLISSSSSAAAGLSSHREASDHGWWQEEILKSSCNVWSSI